MMGPTRDAARLAELHALCFPHAPWNAETMAAMLAIPGTEAWMDDARNAFVMIRADGEQADMLTLCTHPAARRQGLARQLLAVMQTALTAHGLHRVTLEVEADNQAARALYASLGYRRIGLRKGYYARLDSAEDAIVMALALRASA